MVVAINPEEEGKDLRVPFDVAMFSGKITAVYPPNPDKHGNNKISFSISLKPAGKNGKQSYAHLITYDLSLQSQEWFKVGNYVYTQSKVKANGYYVTEIVTNNAYDCYQDFIQRVYGETSND